jgi:rhodanese-related sulfurtransferase
MIKKISVNEINKKLGDGNECQVIDVREFSEWDSERIAEAQLMPLSNFEKHIAEIDHNKPVYLFCRSGNRAGRAAEKLSNMGFTDVHVVEGGLQAWTQAELPVIKGESKIWSLERQVRFAAGFLVLAGVLLSVFAHRHFIWLAAFVGGGLVFAAVTDTCGMAMMLARMPWNRQKGASCTTAR